MAEDNRLELVSTRRDGVATLTMNRAERGNALSAELVEALLDGVNAALEDDEVHTLVLRGQGRHFCTGLDLSDMDQASDATLLWRLVRIETLLTTVWQAPKCTVAVAQGRTWGAGADLFVACEQRVALPGVTFRFPGAQFGIVLGTRRLALRLGSGAARDLLASGGELDTAQALACGLASHAEEPRWPAPKVDAATGAALRTATRAAEGGDLRDADLAALVRSAARPGLVSRVGRYVESLKPTQTTRTAQAAQTVQATAPEPPAAETRAQ
jgi:enoyl-CoA hydratase/carnithine racemase